MNCALPTFSDEALVRDRLHQLGMSPTVLAALVGIPQTRISQGFRGIRAFERAEGHKMKALLAELLELQQALRPIPLNLSNPVDLRALLDALRMSGATAEKVREKIAELFQTERTDVNRRKPEGSNNE